MAGVFVFFRKYIREANRDMFDFHIFLLYFFANSIFPDLYVSEPFRSHAFGPTNARCVVLVYCCS